MRAFLDAVTIPREMRYGAMGADIFTVVEHRVLTPRFPDHQMRDLERAMITGNIEIEDWESAHEATWHEVQIARRRAGEPSYGLDDVDELDVWLDMAYEPVHKDVRPWHEWRNYGLFGIIGGVRSRGGDPITEAHFRGLPEGFSGNLEGMHSITWYMCQELIDANIPERMPYAYGITSDVERFVNMNKDLVKKYGKENVRITMGWDC